MAGRDEGIYTYVKTCAKCGGNSIKTINTEVRKYGEVYRRKVCNKCGYAFGTIEVEKCASDVGELLMELEKEQEKNATLAKRINAIKDYVRNS